MIRRPPRSTQVLTLFPYTTLFRSKQKTAYEISPRDWSSDVCSSDLHPPRFLTTPVGEGHGVWRVALQQLARSSRRRRGRGRADGALWNRAFSGKWCGDDERRARAGHWHVSWALGSGESETALPVALSVKTALFCLLPASYANGATALLGTHLEELQCKSLSPAKFPCVEQRWFLQLLRIKSPCVERAFVWCNHIILSQKS